MSIAPLGTNFNEISMGIQTFSFKKMHFKLSSAKWRPFCLGLNVIIAPEIAAERHAQLSLLSQLKEILLTSAVVEEDDGVFPATEGYHLHHHSAHIRHLVAEKFRHRAADLGCLRVALCPQHTEVSSGVEVPDGGFYYQLWRAGIYIEEGHGTGIGVLTYCKRWKRDV